MAGLRSTGARSVFYTFEAKGNPTQRLNATTPQQQAALQQEIMMLASPFLHTKKYTGILWLLDDFMIRKLVSLQARKDLGWKKSKELAKQRFQNKTFAEQKGMLRDFYEGQLKLKMPDFNNPNVRGSLLP